MISEPYYEMEENIIQGVMKTEIKKILYNILETLTETERSVLTLTYGLYYKEKEKSRAAIARRLNMSYDTVFKLQIEAQHKIYQNEKFQKYFIEEIKGKRKYYNEISSIELNLITEC